MNILVLCTADAIVLIRATFPALLNISSKRSCHRAGLDSATAYTTTFFSSDTFSKFVAVFGVFLVVFVFASLVLGA